MEPKDLLYMPNCSSIIMLKFYLLMPDEDALEILTCYNVTKLRYHIDPRLMYKISLYNAKLLKHNTVYNLYDVSDEHIY